MKAKLLLLFVVTAALGGLAGWFAAQHRHGSVGASATAEGKVYSCSMHPQIRSNKPGKCPICGMALAPIGTGQVPADGSIMLSSNVINVLHVQTQPVQRGALVKTLRVAGTIDDDATRHRFVSAYIDGRIDKLSVNYTGAEVVEGQPLATFYSPMLLAAEQEYGLLLSQKANAALPDHDRLIAIAEQRLRRLGLTVEQIKDVAAKRGTNLHTQIVAPVSGTVVQRLVYEGQYVKEGEKLFEIADFSTMWFQFDAYERDLAWFKPGEMVDVTAPSVPGKVYRAPITFIDPNLNEMTRTAKVRVTLENPSTRSEGGQRRELLHKTYAEGSVKVEVPNTLLVPRSAVLSPGSRPIVYVEKSAGLYDQRPVKLGRVGDEHWEVLEGVSEGEQVVTSGNMLIDAQAQLNQGGSSPSLQPVTLDFTEHQQKAVGDLISLEHNLSAALAADSVEKFNALEATAGPIVEHVIGAFAGSEQWNPIIAQIRASAQFKPAADLKDARKMFQPFAAAVVEVARRARQQPAFATVRLFRCPMTEQAYSGAPKTAMWVQTNAPLRNPFYGSEMIDCGAEVK
jgi:membrane fusion protein, copper/silver efflux system